MQYINFRDEKGIKEKRDEETDEIKKCVEKYENHMHAYPYSVHTPIATRNNNSSPSSK